jgi:hypothetical protein
MQLSVNAFGIKKFNPFVSSFNAAYKPFWNSVYKIEISEFNFLKKIK